MRRAPRSYTVLFHPCDGGWSAFFPAFPNLIVWFKSLERTKHEAPKALRFHLRCMQREGLPIPVERGHGVELQSVAV